MPGEVLVIGLGNPDRGDDGVGRACARRLASLALPGLHVVERGGEALTLMETWAGHRRVVLVDAAASGETPGTVHRFDAGAGRLPELRREASSHGMGLAQAVELARALGRLPAECRVVAVEGSDFTPGSSLSPPVAAALDEAVAAVRAEAAGLRGTDDA